MIFNSKIIEIYVDIIRIAHCIAWCQIIVWIANFIQYQRPVIKDINGFTDAAKII